MNAPDRIDSAVIKHWLTPGRLWSLLDMLKVNATAFTSATTMLNRIQAIIENAPQDELLDPINEDLRGKSSTQLGALNRSIKPLNLELSEMAIRRSIKKMKSAEYSLKDLREDFLEIEHRMN